VLDWSEVEKDEHGRLLEWYRTLIALRRAEPDLRDPTVRVSAAAEDGPVLRVERGAFTVLANLGGERREATVPAGAEVVLRGGDAQLGEAVVALPPDAVVLLRRPPDDAG
jgi:maltooligosyltrehalose trehalohydrolase